MTDEITVDDLRRQIAELRRRLAELEAEERRRRECGASQVKWEGRRPVDYQLPGSSIYLDMEAGQ